MIFGEWSYPLIALAAIAVMWSTVLALMDALPRVSARLIDCMTGRDDQAETRYTSLLLVQVVGVSLIMMLLLHSFDAFIDFATSAGFITAPALAYYNYRAVRSATVAPYYKPTTSLLVWHWTGFAAMSAFAIAFFIERLS